MPFELCTEYDNLQEEVLLPFPWGLLGPEGVEQTEAQCLVIFLVLEGALGGMEGKKPTRIPLITQPWGLSMLSNSQSVKPSDGKSSSARESTRVMPIS